MQCKYFTIPEAQKALVQPTTTVKQWFPNWGTHSTVTNPTYRIYRFVQGIRSFIK